MDREKFFKAIKDIAFEAHKRNGDPFSTSTLILVQALCVAEEAGETVKKIRRYTGHARKPAEIFEVGEEMADIIISTYVLAETLPLNLDAAVEKKLQKIKERGGL